jgi:uncharacterized damage-inducible protein DinB
MTIGQGMAAELEYSAKSARKVLERTPTDKFDWKPHEKSMGFIELASHIAESIGWAGDVIVSEEFDVAPPDGPAYEGFKATTVDGLLAEFDKNLGKALQTLRDVSDEDLMKTWSMKKGGEVMFAMPRVAVLRGFVLDHLVHHRAQLGLYLRLNDISVPAMLGPSADEDQ